MPRKNRFNKRHNSRKVEHYHFYPQYAAQNYQPRAMGNGWYCVFSPKGEDFYYHTSWLVNRSNYYARTSYGYQDTGLYTIPPLKRSENGPGNTNYNKPFFNFTYQNPNTNLNNNKPIFNFSKPNPTNTPIFNFSKPPQTSVPTNPPTTFGPTTFGPTIITPLNITLFIYRSCYLINLYFYIILRNGVNCVNIDRGW